MRRSTIERLHKFKIANGRDSWVEQGYNIRKAIYEKLGDKVELICPALVLISNVFGKGDPKEIGELEILLGFDFDVSWQEWPEEYEQFEVFSDEDWHRSQSHWILRGDDAEELAEEIVRIKEGKGRWGDIELPKNDPKAWEELEKTVTKNCNNTEVLRQLNSSASLKTLHKLLSGNQ